MEFPKIVKIKNLKQKSKKEKSKNKIYEALYRGGSSMTTEIKKSLILKRANEIQFQPMQYERRLERAWYINRAGGIVDWVISSATKDTPKIIVSENATEEQAKFWMSKNLDVDGSGKPFANLFRELLQNQLVNSKAYLETLVVDKENISLHCVDPEMVVDVGYSSEGKWIKTYSINRYKSSPFSNQEITENIWTIYTDTDTVVYKAISMSDENSGNQIYEQLEGIYKNEDEDAEAYLDIDSSVFDHNFGLPLICAYSNRDENWLMDRISQNIIALYNAESDLAWVLSEAAYPQGILKLESEARFQTVYNKSESAIWNLLPDEDYKIVSSSGIDFTAQFNNVDRLKLSLHESMQMLAREAAAIPQAGRLSGEAVKEMRTPLDALLQSFCWPIVDLINDAITKIKKYRNEEDLGVYIAGLNTSADDLELRKIIMGDVYAPVKEEEVEEDVEDEENSEDEDDE